jgi:hypothetical protein
MGEIQCFWTEPTNRVTRELRRYVSGESSCSGRYGFHNASTPIQPAEIVPAADGSYRGDEDVAPFAGDPRWPTSCECGYEFKPEDERQVFRVRIYRAADGREWPLRQLPPGAMYDATWYHGMQHCCGPDGIALVVILPPASGDADWWHVDGSANNNPSPQGWTRTGTIPNVTATPSILTPRYHGWLRDGKLVEC